MISTPYAPEASGGVRWDDPVFAIVWPPAAVRMIGAHDRRWPDFEPQGS